MRSFLLLTLIFLVTACNAGFCQGNRIALKKSPIEINVDGVIDPVWNMADSVEIRFEKEPFYEAKPSQRTVARVLSTEEAIYCLIVAYDTTGKIQLNSGTLDQYEGDLVSIMLDTYNDRRTAYRFCVTAAGVKSDCRMIDDGRDRDYNWDGVWFSDTRVYNWGYVVEMKIPYRSISYNKAMNEWGVDFDRWIPHSNEDLYWSHYERSEGLRISRFGRLIFDEIKPQNSAMNLEVYPVGLTNMILADNGKYKVKPDAGLDVFYNPSPSLTFQLTANPDFAQIEADPYSFNISRYETHFDEKRPFFTQGNEIFMASGKQSSSGFYSPLELFYSRRIGKVLPDGSEVPLLAGAKAFGRIGTWEYGSFLALSGDKDYRYNDRMQKEEEGYFGAARIKKQIMGNSTLGMLLVNKSTKDGSSGVIDLDGAFRQSDWQLSYQFARSFKNSSGDYAMSSGFMLQKETWLLFTRGRYIGEDFDISDVGYVPWKGTAQLTTISGPMFYFDKGFAKSTLLYFGGSLDYEKADEYTDRTLIVGWNMQMRSNWGFELTYNYGKARDLGVNYNSSELDLSSWLDISPDWSSSLQAGISRTYNFSRNYLASYMWLNDTFEWKTTKTLNLGFDYNMWIEKKPSGSLEDITYNSRPYISLIPVNNLTLRLYVDNVYLKSSDRLESLIVGFLFSYNFLPKSWIYFAYNESQSRLPLLDGEGKELPVYKMKVTDRASVFKIKYLYYF
ncbi:MAG: carbohydrate binding family 9 domain-containing protein [Ignavibacteria bacterium]|jgi:hypothetical protein|nr:carbohydrate binding family 9 domain-containing protein [Ignavibacteria bacterium]MCU7503461.1 carbohydrate binding family 9 domain-containing protein [Ignavibacteria bacterium]MCU7516207.1 carbohydrate binding family 9 domain-containing protein [Ignavibacteria bacterium]